MAQDFHIKPSLPLLMDRILENLLLANISGSYMIIKIKNFLAYHENFFIPRSPRTMRNNRSSPHNKKNVSLKSYYLCITNIEIVQNSKSKPKKFSFLCTFKVCKKCYYDPKICFLEKYQYGYQKTQNFMLIPNSLMPT